MKADVCTLNTQRGPVEYARSGDGLPVLLLHGAMGGYDQGLLLGRAVLPTSGFESIAISRPGYLGTPLALGPAPEQQADLCAAVLDAIARPQAAVIAISGGGQCALQFALRHPGRCRALIMISACSAQIAGRVPFRFHVLTFAARFDSVARAMKRRAAADPERAASRSIPDPELRARTLNDPEAGPLLLAQQASIFERMPARLPGTRNDIMQSRSPFAYPVEQIRVPTLVVHGTDDEAAPFAHAESLAARIPGAELVAIEGGRHVSLFTHNSLIRARVTRFLGVPR